MSNIIKNKTTISLGTESKRIRRNNRELGEIIVNIMNIFKISYIK